MIPIDPHMVGKFEAGALDEDVQAADMLQEYETKTLPWSGWWSGRRWRSSF